MAVAIRKIGDILVKAGLINDEQLVHALEIQKEKGLLLGDILCSLGYLSQNELSSCLSKHFEVPHADLENTVFDKTLISIFPVHLARKYNAIPVLKVGDTLFVALDNPNDFYTIEKIQNSVQLNVEACFALKDEILTAFRDFYSENADIETEISDISEEYLSSQGDDSEEDIPDDVDESSAPIIKLVNLLIANAVKSRASDIHIEPKKDRLCIRYRIDGDLVEVPAPPQKIRDAVISRIKILSSIDISENRVPQDGRFTMAVDGRDVDARVSIIPTVTGPNIVLRLLDQKTDIFALQNIGLSQANLELFEKLIKSPFGIVLVTGPTGSGKSTTLCAVLNHVNSSTKHIVTVEDPVEYNLSFARQIQVNDRVGMTFSKALRAILRHDPDVIMVGEIRDEETLALGLRASITGHLVFATLHTNDTISTVSRIMDLGAGPYMIATSTIGILAQRLVKVLCPNCKEPYPVTDEVVSHFNLSPDEVLGDTLYRPRGCVLCNKAGYKGRLGIFEILHIDHELKKMVSEGVHDHTLEEKAHAKGMVTLRRDGIEKAFAGTTSLEEVMRVVF